ncbi:MAG: phosphopantothenoylcysteine decarboxylase [Sedimentisphaerales bacterium]|nr:phosphopantothenoylcysteine decarboxylase [Sedimentisphaerales bacterium]
MNFLITSGGTREYIDPVRFISNASSGKMGLALTRAALKAGHKVTLITTIKNSKLKTQNSKLRIVPVETAAEMFKAVKKHFPRCDCLIMAAAVADYTPAQLSKTKIKSGKRELTIRLNPTVDILKWAGNHKNLKLKTQNSKLQRRRRFVVGFALEDKNLRKLAEKKLLEKNLDMIIANTPAAIGADKISVRIKTYEDRWIKLPFASKEAIAQKIISLSGKLIPRD